ncbi:MAG: dihydrofolate reductase family protein [Bacteroidetes bacterium]|nr:MAG: dihydrofolate reductase family protein [Bacteroidota bacterium]
MSKVFVSVGVSLDGYIAGPNGGPTNPLGDGGTCIHQWMYATRSFMSHLGNGDGETGTDNDVVETLFNRAGAHIIGKRMFNEGETNWPENAPFGAAVYVLTQQKRDPWERLGGTTFYFTNEDIYAVLQKAKQDAGTKDVRITGGANIITQYLNAGLVDELTLHIAPIMMGNGVRLFDGVDKTKFSLDVKGVINSNLVTHITYNVLKQK